MAEGEDAKTLIKRAALKLFADNGFSGTSVRQISNEAKVNIASISYHFGSKDGLLEALFKDINNDHLQSMILNLEPASSSEEFLIKLKNFTREFIAISLRETNRSEMIFRNIEHFAENYPELFASTFGEMHMKIHGFLDAAALQGIIRNDVPSMLIGQMFMSSLTDIVRNRSFRNKLLGFAIEDPETSENYVDALVMCLMNGVKNNAN